MRRRRRNTDEPAPRPDPAPGSFAEATTSELVVSSGAWNAVSHLIPQVYTVVQSVAAARFLGPEGMGRQSFVAWAVLSLVFLWSRGLPDAMLRFAAETLGRGRPGDLRGLARWAVRIELAVAAGAVVVAVLVGLARGELLAAWTLAGFAGATNIVRSVPLALLRAAHQWREAATIGVVSGAVTMVATVAVLAAGGGITGMFAVEAAVGLGATLYARSRASARLAALPGEVTVDAELHGRVSRYARAASFQAVFAYVVWQRSEFVLLDVFGTDEQIALYSIAFGAVAVLGRLLQGFAAVVPSSVATLYGAGDLTRIRGGLGRGLRLLLVVTFPVAAISAATGPAALRLLYGERYAEAGTVLVLMLAAVPAIALYHVGFGVLQGFGRLRLVLAASLAGAVVDVGVAGALVPYHGARGAAVANAAAQAAAAAVVVAGAVRTAGAVRWDPLRLAGAALGAGCAGVLARLAVLALPGVLGVVAGGAGGLAAYAVLVRPFRMVSPGDAEWLARVLGSRLGRWAGRLAAR